MPSKHLRIRLRECYAPQMSLELHYVWLLLLTDGAFRAVAIANGCVSSAAFNMTADCIWLVIVRSRRAYARNKQCSSPELRIRVASDVYADRGASHCVLLPLMRGCIPCGLGVYNLTSGYAWFRIINLTGQRPVLITEPAYLRFDMNVHFGCLLLCSKRLQHA